MLDEAKSTYYLEPFNKLASLIEEGSDEAIDNLKYLQTVQPACENLSVCSVKGIPVLLPEILRTMQMIFHNSKFYNTPERLVGMLRKISNEIIMRCSGQISLQAIFDGNVQASMVTLQVCDSMGFASCEAKMLCNSIMSLRPSALRGPTARCVRAVCALCDNAPLNLASQEQASRGAGLPALAAHFSPTQ